MNEFVPLWHLAHLFHPFQPLGRSKGSEGKHYAVILLLAETPFFLLKVRWWIFPQARERDWFEALEFSCEPEMDESLTLNLTNSPGLNPNLKHFSDHH